jgi:hypothetical protein
LTWRDFRELSGRDVGWRVGERNKWRSTRATRFGLEGKKREKKKAQHRAVDTSDLINTGNRKEERRRRLVERRWRDPGSDRYDRSQ